ncbi:MAG TPA: Gfo/Idh/MocA family oxidoreductase [Bryobacteraceae bacterium]|nr:Gfo/Idh/MocA family oxidoreductase [Bryobacteraceae bacterium]
MNEVRIGIIGSGFMGRTNAETVTKYLKGARLVAVTGGSRAAALAAEYGAECEPSVEALVGRADVDAVLISTPHAAHTVQAVAAAQGGKHILLDKPMATTVEDCDRILAAVHAANVKLMIMYGQRFRTCNMEARRLIREGAIGNVRSVMELILATGGLGTLPPWQSRPENCGTFIGHAVHNIDRLRWLTGAEITSVSAQVRRDPSTGNEVETMALFSLSSGAMATVWESWDVAAPAFPRSGSGAWIAGDSGNLDLDAYGELRLGRGGEWKTVAVQEPIDWKGQGMLSPVRMKAYQAQHQEFVNSILEDRTPSVTGEDGRAAVEAAVAAYRSAAEGRTIQLGAREAVR